MGRDHLLGQRQVVPAGCRDSLRHPPRTAGIHPDSARARRSPIAPRTRPDGRRTEPRRTPPSPQAVSRHAPGRALVEDRGLLRTRRAGLLRRQLQQPQQPGVLRAQPGDLRPQAGQFRGWVLRGHAGLHACSVYRPTLRRTSPSRTVGRLSRGDEAGAVEFQESSFASPMCGGGPSGLAPGTVRRRWVILRSTRRSAVPCATSSRSSAPTYPRCSRAGPRTTSPPTSCCVSATSSRGPASSFPDRSNGSPSGAG